MRWPWRQLDHMQIICTLLQTDSHASTSSLNFLQAGCSSWCPANSVKLWGHNQQPQLCQGKDLMYLESQNSRVSCVSCTVVSKCVSIVSHQTIHVAIGYFREVFSGSSFCWFFDRIHLSQMCLWAHWVVFNLSLSMLLLQKLIGLHCNSYCGFDLRYGYILITYFLYTAEHWLWFSVKLCTLPFCC